MKTLYQTKTITKTFLSLCFAAVFIAIGFYACKKPTDGVNLIVNTSSLSVAPVLVQFANANNASATALPANFPVTISGTGAKFVQVDGGGTKFTVTNGLLPISLTSGAAPSDTNPIVFTVYAAVAGFAPVSRTVTITKDSVLNAVVNLVEFAHPPAGTSSLIQQNTLTNGVITNTTSLATPTNSAMNETSVLTIATGTQMLDANGAVINTTQLKSNILHLGAITAASYNAFPGGFNPTNVIGPNGQAMPGGVALVTAGLVSINMVAGTTDVKSFSKPLQLTTEINNALINPTTGVAVKVGDVIPVWSLNEQTGQWKYEGATSVTTDANGKLAAISSVTHLSAWSVSWYSPYCTSANIKLTVHIPSKVQYTNCELALVTANDQYLGGLYTDNTFASTVSIMDGTVYAVKGSNLPTNYGNLKYVLYSRRGDPTSKIAESSTFNACQTSTVDMNVPTAPMPDYTKVIIKFTALCPNKQVVTIPSGWVVIHNVNRLPNGGYDVQAFAYNGQLYNNISPAFYQSVSASAKELQLINGDTYVMGISYGGVYYSTNNFVISKTSFAITAANGFSATSQYNSSTSTIEINATMTLPNCN